MMNIKVRKAVLNALPKDGIMLEWGSGDNTIWFLDNLKPDQHLISLEHHRGWYQKISEKTKAHKNYMQHSYLLYPNEYPLKVNTTELSVFATPYEELSAGLSPYIHPFGLVNLKKVDVFLIDGVARGACLATVRVKSKDSVVVFLHDIENRSWYDWAIDLWEPNAIYVTPNLLKLMKPISK